MIGNSLNSNQVKIRIKIIVKLLKLGVFNATISRLISGFDVTNFCKSVSWKNNLKFA